MRHPKQITLTILVATLIAAPMAHADTQRVIVATTTSLYETGLLDQLKTAFEATHPDIRVDFIPQGTGLALETARRGDAHMVIVHSPALEAQFLGEGYGLDRRILAYNFFTIVGPASDPAGVEGLDALEALKRIAGAGGRGEALWVSRGDRSGTHVKELELWDAAGVGSPAGGSWVVETGSGMTNTLRVANELGGYVLTDRATYLRNAAQGLVSLIELVQPSKEMLNIYSSILVNPPGQQPPEAARLFHGFLVGEEAQSIIEHYGAEELGANLFNAWVPRAGGGGEAAWVEELGYINGSECPPTHRLPANPSRGWATLTASLRKAVTLLIGGDPTVARITLRSIYASGLATLTASALGLPLSLALAVYKFPGRGKVKLLLNTLVGLPTVTLGLILYTLLSTSGPLAPLGLLYTLEGVALGQALLVLPLVSSFALEVLEAKEREVGELLATLGASRLQSNLVLLREAAPGVLLSVLTGFNRAFAELGIAMMLGGNIKGVSRVLTTTIALESSKGDLATSFALSIVLLAVALTLNALAEEFRRARL